MTYAGVFPHSRQKRERCLQMLNKVTIIGRLGADPEGSYTPNGASVSRFSVATDRKWTDQATGEKKSETTWFTVVAWNKLADITNEYLHKGGQVYVEGRIQTRKYTGSDGVTRYPWEVVAERLVMLGEKNTRREPIDEEAAADESPF